MEGIEILLFGIVREKGYENTALVSVYGTASFWERFGFEVVVDDDDDDDDDESMMGKLALACYGEGAVFMVRKNE